ncbi:MAG TPA: leucine-rich repeat domain-containing protein [Chitinophagaceae bacterium]
MQDERIENGILYVTGDEGELMVFSSSHLDKCVKIFNETDFGNATLGFVYSSQGYNEKNLGVLSKIKARKLIINPAIIEDYSGLYSQDTLEYLRITSDSDKTEIDFAKLPALKRFEGFWSKKIYNLFSSQSIAEMTLMDYKPKRSDLAELAGMINLEVLALHYTNVKSLQGLEKLNKLRKLTLGYDKAITDLSIPGITSLPVKELKIWSCNKINFDSIKIFDKVKRLDLNSVGEIKSLENIIAVLPSLEELVFEESKLTEGNNLYFLKHPSLKKITIDDKKHYLLKETEINDALSDPAVKAALLKKHNK